MTSPSPARSKTTPSSGKLNAWRIVKKYQRLRKTGLLYLGFIYLELQLLDGLPLPLTLLVRAILLLRTSAAIELASYLVTYLQILNYVIIIPCAVKGYAWAFCVGSSKIDQYEVG